MKRSKLIKTSIILLIAGLLMLHFYAPRFIIEINNPILNIIRSEFKPALKFEDDLTFTSKSVGFKTHDNLMLLARICKSNVNTVNGTIILLHGIRAGKEHYVPICKRLVENGYNAVALDLRAHGESEGIFCTFGVKEKRDIITLIDYLQNEEGIKSPIGIWGQSLGGAVALQAMAIDERINFGIVESTFSDFRSIVGDYSKYHLGFNFPFLNNYLIDRAGKIGDFGPDQARPVDFCKQIKQPILMVHGAQDQRIKIEHGWRNYENLQSKKKYFHEVTQASHLNVWEKGGDAYFDRIFEFLERH